VFKPITMEARRDFVCPNDPAIDDEAMTAEDWAAYQDAWRYGGDWRSLLKILPGEQPTVFTLGPLTADELNAIVDDTRGANGGRSDDRWWRCFLLGLRDITGWPQAVPKADGRVDKDWLRKTFIGPLRRVALSVGVAVMTYNQITEDEVKNWSGRSKARSATAAPSAPSAPTDSASVVVAAGQG